MSTTNIALLEQTGSWQSIQIATLDEIKIMPDIITNENASQIEIVGAYETIDILPLPESVNITHSKTQSKKGVEHAIKIQFDFPAQSAALDNFLYLYEGKKVIAIGIKPSGTEKLFGSKLSPLLFDYDLIDGKSIDDGSVTRVIISGKTTQKPVFIKD
jgi:hypothetical protein